MNTIWIVLPILTLLMFDLGLALRFEDFGKVFRKPWPSIRKCCAPTANVCWRKCTAVSVMPYSRTAAAKAARW